MGICSLELNFEDSACCVALLTGLMCTALPSSSILLRNAVMCTQHFPNPACPEHSGNNNVSSTVCIYY
jgi:hypothetical protein